MEESVRQLEAAGFSGKTMVGGAVLTEEYAKAIGADFYAHDALSGVAYARQIVG